jgi:hypothetical protein
MYSEKAKNENQRQNSFSPAEELKIDAPDSLFEKEAESGAMKVMNGDQLTGNNYSSKGQVMGNSHNGKEMIAPAYVKEKINATKGKGNELPEDAKRMMGGNAQGEMDEIRIHTDSNAAELSKTVNAKAFTVGKDIYFGQGMFDTYTSNGKQLLAHELAHTQQNAGAGLIQREPQKTAWGEFNDSYYDVKAKWHNKKLKAGIVLEFMPNELVNAKKIAMLQISQQYYVDKDGRHITYLDDTEEKQSIQKMDAKDNKQLDENEEGFQIDQDPPDKANPLYAGKELEPGKELKDTEPEKEFGKFGCNYVDGVNGLKTEKAVLGDAPRDFRTRGVTEIGGTFETTALAIDGEQAGTYYGSVAWGYKLNASGVTKKELTKISDGGVSTTFLKAAQMWNMSKTSEGKDTIPLQVPEYYQTTETADFYGGDVFSASEGMRLKPPVRVEILGKNIPVKEMPQLIRVRIIDGLYAGTEGWIDGTSLEKEDITVHPFGTK